MDYWQNEPHRQCRTCPPLSLEQIFDPTQFDTPTSPGTATNRSWSKDIRKIHTFTSQSIDMNDDPCGFCFFVRKVCPLADRAPIPPSYLPANPFVKIPGPKPSDGDGFTLATVSTQSMFNLSDGDSNAVDYSTDDRSASSDGRKPPAAVWLLVIKGRNTLERVAYEFETTGMSNISQLVMTAVRVIVTNSGLFVAEATDGPFNKGPLFRSLLVSTDKVKYEHLRSWLKSCVDHHEGCKFSAGPPNAHMKLIDCESRTLVSAKPDMPYAAVSYVWGTGPLEKYDYPSLPSNLPATILDSMTVALKIGIRYLWVDRYCIWQDDPVHKMAQVRAMEEVYRNALVTIVAAGGSDPQYGLPGVGTTRTRKKGQMLGRAGPRTLLSGPTHQRQRDTIRGSKWNSRAWTFQESVLSPRMLIFTDYEASFHCFQSECFEHLSHPISPDGKEGFRRGIESASNVQAPDGISGLIFSYTQRQMTYSSDALNAFYGVLSPWCKANSCYHYWAVPIRLPKRPNECTKGELLDALWSGLCWRHVNSTFRRGVRREGFPTWSWLGLEAGIQETKWWKLEKGTTLDTSVKVSTLDNQQIDWCGFVASGGLSLPPSEWGTDLYLEGWVFTVGPFKKRTDRQGQAYYIPDIDPQTGKVLPHNILEFLSDLGTDTPPSLLTNTFEAISPSLVSDVALVFEKNRDKVKRIGLLHLVVYISEPNSNTVHQPYRCDIARSFKPERRIVCFS